mmetsp:Transcript_34068/g.64860  ORF Transcript_34068/g.64860 Transcript_34068/m.64860 type:complete len:208 (+) Transcript_34068:480-1103(+)
MGWSDHFFDILECQVCGSNEKSVWLYTYIDTFQFVGIGNNYNPVSHSSNSTQTSLTRTSTTSIVILCNDRRKDLATHPTRIPKLVPHTRSSTGGFSVFARDGLPVHKDAAVFADAHLVTDHVVDGPCRDATQHDVAPQRLHIEGLKSSTLYRLDDSIGGYHGEMSSRLVHESGRVSSFSECVSIAFDSLARNQSDGLSRFHWCRRLA